MEIGVSDNATTLSGLGKGKDSPSLVLSWIRQNIVTTILTAFTITLVYAFFSIKRYRESVINQVSKIRTLP